MKDVLTVINIGNMKIKIPPSDFNSSTNKMYSLAHSHANFEFHIVFRGNFVMDIEDKKINMRPNDSVLIFPNTFHRISSQDENSAMLCFTFPIEKNDKQDESDYYTIFREFVAREGEYAIVQQNPLIGEYVRRINAHLNLNSVFAKETVKAFLVLLFTELLLPAFGNSNISDTTAIETTEYDSRIQMIENYFNDHYMEDISLSKLSAMLCLSERQTNRMISHAFGTEFRECLSKIRLKTAKKLLCETNNSVKDIAEAVGYQTYNGFYLAFRSKFGISPLKYREQKKLDTRCVRDRTS